MSGRPNGDRLVTESANSAGGPSRVLEYSKDGQMNESTHIMQEANSRDQNPNQANLPEQTL